MGIKDGRLNVSLSLRSVEVVVTALQSDIMRTKNTIEERKALGKETYMFDSWLRDAEKLYKKFRKAEWDMKTKMFKGEDL